jgi:glycosyltransferase involved in cell wall biosynthesis
MKKKIPFFSIITATYNVGYHLNITANSLRNQSFKDFEWILIDGGSTDDTLSFIEINRDLISKSVAEPDMGIYDAWNKGLKLATGKWIAFLGAGDEYLPDALFSYFNYINENRKCNFVSSRITLTRDQNLIKEIGERFNKVKMQNRMNIAHVGSMHRTNIFKKNGYFNTQYKASGDYEFFMRAINDIKAGFLNKNTAIMPVGGSSGNKRSLIETYNIQIVYLGIIRAKLNYMVALIKWKIRNIIFKY